MNAAFEPIVHKEANWTLRLTNPAPGVFCSQLDGRPDEDAVHLMLEGFERVSQRWGRSDAFHDWNGVTGYTSEARRVYTVGAKRQTPLVTSAHILIASKLVAMGISVASIALGPLSVRVKTYTDADAFHAARSACMLHHRASSAD